MSNTIFIVPETTEIYDLMSAKAANNYEARSIDIFFNVKPFMLLGHLNSIDDFTYMMPLGFRTYAPPGADMLLLPRSSSGNVSKLPPTLDDPPYMDLLKENNVQLFDATCIQLANTIGYIDWDYRNEWKGLIRVNRDIMIDPSRAYLQAVPMEPSQFKFKIVKSIDEVPSFLLNTSRGQKGFGSTG